VNPEHLQPPCFFIQGETKKRELLKCVIAAMYSWQHCGTGTLSYRQLHHLVIMDQWNGEQCAVAIKMFYMFGFLVATSQQLKVHATHTKNC
jgi:hypothetical protein